MIENTLQQNSESNSSSNIHLLNIFFIKERFDAIIVFLVLVSNITILLICIKFRLIQSWLEFLNYSKVLKIASYPILISTIGAIGALAFQTIFWLRYKPDNDFYKNETIDLPLISVIVAARNEEKLISRSINSIFASNYPQNKLEVICINDGSVDDTFFHMIRIKKKHSPRLKIINFKKNVGKRRALYSGMKNARGEIIILFDADSVLEYNAIRNLVIPLMNEEKIGAVSGRVAVLNEKENFLTKMLSVRYSISFDFGRAYQSVYGSVVCCAGALSAYRRDLFVSIIKESLKQEFLSVPCNHGEDRALTTLVLKSGYYTKYQSNAVVFTMVPSKLVQMNRMYLRWTRSHIRESVFLARFLFSNYRDKYKILPIIDFFFMNFLHLFHFFSSGLFIYLFVFNPLFLAHNIPILIIIALMLSLFYFRESKNLSFLYGIPYGLLAILFLWWIVPFSILTLKNQSWLTR
jgi:hyaluronan synthase